MASPYSLEVKRGPDGRIVEKIETVSGEPVTWTYSYDKGGRLAEARLDGRLVCRCDYDREGRRIRDLFPLRCGNSYRNYAYRMDNRLMQAGDNRYTHDGQGFRSIWSHRANYTTYKYAQDYRLLEVHKEDEDIRFTFEHDGDGRRMVKYHNGKLAEAYKWLDFIRLAGFYDGRHAHEFVYEGEARVPYAMIRDDGAEAWLYYDQVGSLRVVADTNGNVIKEIVYDPFGSIIEDTNPSLPIPIGFAGGLHDHDLGLVRFGWRDYDPNTARWTAPDPLGDTGGDKDWYGYCLDDPVNGVDPLGLMGSDPEPPSPEYSFQDVWQWQAQQGACKKSSDHDGNLYFGSMPEFEPLHPNCQCEIVPCYYVYSYGDWVEKNREVRDELLNVFCFGAMCTAYWRRTTEITEERIIDVSRECGDRINHAHNRTETATRTEVEYKSSRATKAFQGGDPQMGDELIVCNPWTDKCKPIQRSPGP